MSMEDQPKKYLLGILINHIVYLVHQEKNSLASSAEVCREGCREFREYSENRASSVESMESPS